MKVAWGNKKKKREIINVFGRDIKYGRIITGWVKCAVEM
jgi:hypothetical protein